MKKVLIIAKLMMAMLAIIIGIILVSDMDISGVIAGIIVIISGLTLLRPDYLKKSSSRKTL